MTNCPIPLRPVLDDHLGVGPSVLKVRVPALWEIADSAIKEAVESAQSLALFDPLIR